ncbi:putative ornithine aminotransferase [Helianthus annuus]|uniref:Ornithine aminotransferase n=1 Tax=Helianthus annuus TaxID=4232 RepID=A0A9K3EKU9_HELAN|nr:putative ornithine aminotransferase [Helianthus annuus]KAJ0499223.1 putative ornithine aminotransferase [Helianthus annuus]KAJ0665239.1 putative ornithine aminotransferase [Helianthus annuus]
MHIARVVMDLPPYKINPKRMKGLHQSVEMGEEFRRLLAKSQQEFLESAMGIRGKGQFNVVELIRKSLFPATAYDLCIKLKEKKNSCKTDS